MYLIFFLLLTSPCHSHLIWCLIWFLRLFLFHSFVRWSRNHCHVRGLLFNSLRKISQFWYRTHFILELPMSSEAAAQRESNKAERNIWTNERKKNGWVIHTTADVKRHINIYSKIALNSCATMHFDSTLVRIDVFEICNAKCDPLNHHFRLKQTCDFAWNSNVWYLYLPQDGFVSKSHWKSSLLRDREKKSADSQSVGRWSFTNWNKRTCFDFT